MLALVRLHLGRTAAGFGGRPIGAARSHRPKTRASCHSPRLGRGAMVQSHPLSFDPRAEPGAIGGVAADDQGLSAAIIASLGKVGKGGQGAQGGGGSDTEAYACACVLQALLEAQP